MSRPLAWFLASNVLTSLSTTVAFLAIAVIAAGSADSIRAGGLAVSITFSVYTFGSAIALPYTSRFARAFGTVRGYMISLIVAAAVFAIEGLLLVAGLPGYPVVLVGSIFTGVCAGLALALKQSSMAAYAGGGDQAKVISWSTVGSGIALVVGAPFAGFLIDATGELGLPLCLFISAAAIIPLVLVLAFVRPKEPATCPDAVTRPWRASLGSLIHRPKLRIICIVGCISCLFIYPLWDLMVPVARDLGHGLAGEAGLLLGFLAIGAMLTPVAVRLLHSQKPLRSSIVGYVAGAIGVIIIAAVAGLVDGRIELVVLGLFLIVLSAATWAGDAFLISLIEENADATSRTGQLATFFLAISLISPIGVLLWGYMFNLVGARWTLAVFGVATVATFSLLSLRRARIVSDAEISHLESAAHAVSAHRRSGRAFRYLL